MRIPALNLRTEVAILFPVALLVLLGLSIFTLFAYRAAVERLTEERREEASRLAAGLAGALGGEGTDPLTLQRLAGRFAPGAAGVAVLDGRGTPIVQSGSFTDANLLLVLGDPAPPAPLGIGPDPELGDVVAGLAPLRIGDDRGYLRLDLAAVELARQSRSLPLLTVVVLGIDAGLFLTVLLYLRHLIAPYESLLERARRLAVTERGESQDEVEFLLATFDRAIDTLSRPAGDDDIAALERTLAPSLESGLLLLDPEGCVLALNGIGAELLGIDVQVAGRPLESALAMHPSLVALLAEAVHSERGVQRRECSLEVDRRTLTLGLTVHPLRRDDGGNRGWLVLFADLTTAEQRAQERRLAESLARLGEITAGAAHEMRNSLASLRGYLSLVERQLERRVEGDEGSGALTESVTEIRHEADHLSRVLEDFLAFARPGSARLEVVDLERVARRAIADPALGGAPVIVDAGSGARPQVRGDAQLLERALRNLVHNAVQAQEGAGEPPPVKVRFERDEEELRLLVEDRGAGIPERMRERLFVPFATGRADGVGLGLAVTHRIVELHGGRVRLEDRRGGGTRAVISFPPDRFATEGNETGAG